MADVFSKEKRSDVMSRIKSKNTLAEVIVFRFLRGNGIYFQKHYKKILGSPDVAFPRKRKVVFIDGDFWHGRNYESFRIKQEAENFWTKKISENMQRDKYQRNKLKDNGWKVLNVWESDIKRKRTRGDMFHNILEFIKA